MNVVCVRQGDKYGPEYVTALRRQVREFADRDLVCLGDDTELVHGFTGWHAKFELFAPEHEELRPCFYLDLDTFILAPIHELLGSPDQLWLIRDLGSPKRSNSGLMKIPKDTSEIWRGIPEWMERWRKRGLPGDGDYLMQFPHSILQDRFGGIVSYKFSAREHPRGRIVCFHGVPKPPQTKGWAFEWWMRYAHEAP